METDRDPAEIAAIALVGRIFLRGGGAPIEVSERGAQRALDDWCAFLGEVTYAMLKKAEALSQADTAPSARGVMHE